MGDPILAFKKWCLQKEEGGTWHPMSFLGPAIWVVFMCALIFALGILPYSLFKIESDLFWLLQMAVITPVVIYYTAA